MAEVPPTSQPPSQARPSSGLYRLEVSRYDRAAGLLLALLILIGAMVTILFVVWLTNRIFASQVAVPFKMEEVGSDEDPMGPGDDIEPPPPQEVEIEEEEVEEILEAVADAVATRAAMLERRVSGEGTGRGGGGTGTGRKGKPRRWKVMFAKGNSLETYAKQLDFFGIELGVKTPNKRMEYAYNLSRPRPSRRSGTIAAENARGWYYLAWESGELQEADRQLMARAGIQVGRQSILKFLPPKTEQLLYTLEQTKADGRPVLSTLFGIEPSGGGYRFTIIRQSYRQ